MRVSRMWTVVWGVAQIGVAIAAQWMQQSVLDAGLAVLSYAAGPVLGAFLLGTLARSIDEGATFGGMIVGLLMMTIVWQWTPAAAMMGCVSNGALTLGARVAEFFDDWRGEDRDSVSIRDLLEHASGLPGRLLDAPPEGRREFEHEICKVRLEYEPRARSIYSDLGFILLGFIAENLGRDLA